MLRGHAVAFVLVMLLSTPGTGRAQTSQCEPDKVAQKYPAYAGKTVKIAASPAGPPYSFSDPRNPDQLIGVEIELIEGAMACAGLKFDYMKGAWSGLLAALFNGSSDVMIGAVNYRPDRVERADFVLYMRVGQSIVTLKDNPKKLSDPSLLCGSVGSATLGGSSSQYVERLSKDCVQQGKPPIQLITAVDRDAAYRQLTNERIDFIMDDAVVAGMHVAKQPAIQVSHTATTDIVSGMVVQKGNAVMQQIIADGLRAQERDGTLAQIVKKYAFPSELLIPIESR